MTTGFLNTLAEYFIDDLKANSSEFCFIFPSQRSSIFFLNHLRDFCDEPYWAPQTITINNFIASLSNKAIADNITLLFTLHAVYNNVTKKDVSFDEFLPWGEMFLNDFGDLDKYLIPIDQLYANLSSLKELEDDYSHLSPEQIEAIQSFWNAFDPQKLSQDQKEFLSIWEQIPEIYLQFKKALAKDEIGFEGMIYREIAEFIKAENHPELHHKKYVFVGLNALTPAEKAVMTYLQKRKLAIFFWDYSHHILPEKSDVDTGLDKSKGPGLFIRQNLLDYPAPKDFNLPINAEGPEITVTAVANPTEQLKVMHQFLKDEYLTDMKTAVVLADEQLLMPALHGIPKNVDRINVTMGYPLNITPIFGLVDLMFELQRQARENAKHEVWLYHRHVLPILQHQYITMLADEEARKLRQELVKKNQIFIKAEDLHRNDLFSLIFSKVNSAGELADYIQNILSKVFDLLKQSENRIIEQEFVYSLYKSINRLQDSLEQNASADIAPETWIKLYRKLADFQTVPFKGEPLAGLQVMGILETRALDFDKLVILDLNEGIFPKGGAPNTFIPANLRLGFGMPTLEQQDTIFSYYFFRLIHRAKKIQVMYSTGSQEGKANEMSRYLYQLKYQFNANIKFETSSGEVSLLPFPETIAHKTVDVINFLNKFKEGGKAMLSPSALSTYIECQLRFYYQKVAQLKEVDEIAEEADARIFGLIFHEVVEQLYTPFVGKEIKEETVQNWLSKPELIDHLILDAFKKHLSDYEKGRAQYTNIHGKNVMVYEVIKRYIKQFLKLEKKNAPFTIVDLEREVKWVYTSENGLKVNLGGFIDRLEEKDNILKVMDYKTGGGEASVAAISDLFKTDKHKKNKATFQTLLYSLILEETGAAPSQTIQPGVIWVKNLFKNDYQTGLFLKEKKGDDIPITLQRFKPEYIKGLDALITEIYNPDVPFSATEDLKKCEYCTFKRLCNR